MTSRSRTGLIVLICAVVTVAMAFGIRQSFGLYMRPITLDLGWGREAFSLVIAVQALLNGLGAPFAGALSDRYGPGRVVFGGALLYALGLCLMAFSTSPTGMLIGGGVLVGLGVSGCGMPLLLGAVGRFAPEERRSAWFGLVTAGGTLGQLVVVPLSQWLIVDFGWSKALLVLAALSALMVVTAAVIRSVESGATEGRSTQSLREALTEARTHSGYVLLTLGFFVCGFQVQFIGAHLPAAIEDAGLGAELAATAIMVIALCNMAGAWYAGVLGGQFRKRTLLSGIYLLRAIVLAAFVLMPHTPTTVLMFSAAIGFIWLGTVPLTSGLVAQMFGPRYMSTLFAIVYLSHQLGNFAGAWAGGRIFDATGSYDIVWWIAAGLGLLAAFMHLVLDDRPVERLRAVSA